MDEDKVPCVNNEGDEVNCFGAEETIVKQVATAICHNDEGAEVECAECAEGDEGCEQIQAKHQTRPVLEECRNDVGEIVACASECDNDEGAEVECAECAEG